MCIRDSCSTGHFGKRKAPSGNRKASGRVKGYGVFSGRFDDPGGSRSGGKRVPGSSNGCGNSLYREVPQPVKCYKDIDVYKRQQEGLTVRS